MRLEKKGPRFVCVSSYDEKEIPKAAKFRWDPDVKQWWTDDPKKATLLIDYASKELQQELKNIDKIRSEAIAASKAQDADISIPKPAGLEYKPFQKAGIEYLCHRMGVYFNLCPLYNYYGCRTKFKHQEVANAKGSIQTSQTDDREAKRGFEAGTLGRGSGESKPQTEIAREISRVENESVRANKKSHASTGHTQETLSCAEKVKLGRTRSNSWWEWCSENCNRENCRADTCAVGFCRRVANQNSLPDTQFQECSKCIQSRFRTSGKENCNRAGQKQHTPKSEAEIFGPEENTDFGKPWLDCHTCRTPITYNGIALLADSMGLGKTIEAIGAINYDPTIKRILIICPLTPRANWRKELKKWLTRPLSIELVDGKFPKSDIVIINYDRLSKHKQDIQAIDWDLLIVDECQALKNPKTQRTGYVLGRFAKKTEDRIEAIPAKRKFFLSGTPLLNRPIELWPILHATGIFNNWKYFVTRYCNGHQGPHGWDVSGASNLDELQNALREKIMVRRLKKDVLKELPPKQRQIMEIPADEYKEFLDQELLIKNKYAAEFKQLKSLLDDSKLEDDAEYNAAVAKLQGVKKKAFQEIAAVRHQTALIKVPAVVEYINECLESEKKVVVFAHHHDVINAILAAFPDIAVSITGDTPEKQRQLIVDQFQEDEKIRLFVGSTTAAGTAITLTAASLVIFAELDWVPANLRQAEDRLHRIGQLDSVLVVHIVLEGSIDADMAQRIVYKQDIFDRTMDREPTKIVEPLPAMKSVIHTKREKLAEKRHKDQEKARLAAELTPEETTEIHWQLKKLAGMCDGAYKLDGAGFNKYDADFGHDLASRERLSPKQALAAKKMLRKYHRQLGL